jgi:glucosamine 6-phosphate synthetase-like amidotransferase/phosphosugar isomerase protein
MKYLLSAFVLLFSLNAALAQNKVLAKAEKAYIDGNLGSANNAIDKCLKDKDNRNNVMVYLLKSKIMLGISKDKNLYSKYPGALKMP